MPKKWIEMAHEKRAHLFPTYWYWKGVQYVGKVLAKPLDGYACYYKNHEMSYLTIENGFIKAGKEILKRLKKDKKLIQKIEAVNITEIPKLLKLSQWFVDHDLSKKSGPELLEQHNKVYDQFLKLMAYSAMATVMEFEKPLLSGHLENILKEKIGDDAVKIGEYFNILSSPTCLTIPQKEEIELRKLRIKEIQKKLRPDQLDKHTKNYSYIAFGYDGPGWSREEIKSRLHALSKRVEKLEKEIIEIKTTPQRIAERQLELVEELRLSKEEKYLFEVLSILGYWKFDRKLINQKSHEMMENFFEELRRRLNLSNPQAKMIAPYEMEEVLVKEKVDVDLLNERIKLSVALFKGYDYEEVISGSKARKMEKEIEKSLAVDKNINEIKGTCAYPGQVKGMVKRVDEEKEMNKFKKGDILISTSTSPKIVPAMKKAGAIVTDSGGITSHAAIVARELKVPCVIGTKIATKVLHDGDNVEVDANQGMVRKI